MLYTPILGAWTDYIVLIFVGATVVGSWISNAKKSANKQRQIDERMGQQDLEEVAARRREELRAASQQRAQANLSGGSSGVSGASGGAAGGGGAGGMTMAERIARARAKAQQEQRTQGGSPQRGQVPNEAQRRVLEQRQAEQLRRREAAAKELRARRQRAQQQSQAQQRAQRQAQQAARQQQAQAHSRAQARARQSGKLIHDPVPVVESAQPVSRRVEPRKTQQAQRAIEQPVLLDEPGAIVAGKLTRNDLRRAIIMNEVLGKPLALKGTGGW